MVVDDRIRLALPRIIALTLIGAAAGAVYGSATSPGAELVGLVRGLLSGAFIAGIVVSLDVFVLLAPGAPLTRAPFLLNVGLRSLIFLAVVLGVITGFKWLLPNGAHPDLDISLNDILFSFAVLFVVTFLFEVNSLLGQNVLLSFVTGRYYRPRVEERVFLIIDMKGSTAAAEQLGEVAFHSLLRRLIGDLSQSIVMHKGEIHKYVGDELIATWPLAEGLKPARCLLACFDAMARAARLGPSYEREFGRRVEIRAALHCGPIVVGEMGSFKKEIALSGDTLNTAARLVDACRETGEPVIASAALIGQLVVPPGIAARALGPIPLHGKKIPVELFALQARAG
jgi:adenylate cyclase